MAYWIFQADPKRYRLLESLAHLDEKLWEVNQYKREIHRGDHALIWKSGDGAGVYAIAQVLSDPVGMASDDDPFWAEGQEERASQVRLRVRIRVVQNLLGRPVLKAHLAQDADLQELSILKFAQATNFRLTAAQWKRIIQLSGAELDEGKPAGRNPPWTRDELILALDLYFKCSPQHTSEKNPEIVGLSRVLNALPIHRDRPDAMRFRNPSGVYMKLANFLRLDPSYSGKGLDAGSKMDEVVWNEFASDRERLGAVVDAIRAQVGVEYEKVVAVLDEDMEAPEGRILLRQHRVRERSGALSRRKKALAKQTDTYMCEVCGFDKEGVAAPLSDAAIECHHKLPLSQIRPGQTTKLSDLMLVCANCHRMLHAGGNAVAMGNALAGRSE